MVHRFCDCELDLERRELRRAGKALHLEPQVFDVLAYLIEHRERMVGKEEILAALWPGRIVSDSALSSRIKSVRQAIGDSGRDQRLVKTLHGRGFRFVAEVTTAVDGAFDAIGPVAPLAAPAAGLYGRDEELGAMHACLKRALEGSLRLLFVRGPAGAGKSTLLQGFLDDVHRQPVGIAVGQCVELHGDCEAFMPVLAAITRRCQAPGGEGLLEVLLSHAPTWAMQLPALMDAERLRLAGMKALGATRERMLRELGDALEAWTAIEPLLVAIEDLHWADPSTVGLIDWIARNPAPLRLLLVATLRPCQPGEDGRVQALVDDLSMRGLAARIYLEPLSLAATRDWLSARLGRDLGESLAGILHARGSGHPLWLTALLDDWIAQGWLVPRENGWDLTATAETLSEGLPPSLQQLIERQFQRLAAEDRALLDAASVHGPDFCAIGLADMLACSPEAMDARCESLAAEGTLIRDAGIRKWPDGRIASTYDFVHQLYRDALYGRLPASRRARLHQRLAEGMEARWGERSGEVAPQLGMHFLRGHYAERAIRYLSRAAEQAFNRTANAECLEYLRLAESALSNLPPGESRLRREREVRTWIGSLRMLSHGFADAEAEGAFRDANEISEKLGEHPATHPAYFALAAMHEFRGEFPTSFAMMQDRVAIGLGGGDTTEALRYCVETHELMACSMFYQGVFERSMENAQAALDHYDADRLYAVDAAFGANPAINCRGWRAFSLCLTGRPDSALTQAEEGIRIATRNDHQHSMVAARHRLALVHCMRGDAAACRSEAERAAHDAALSAVPYNVALTRAVLGWARAALGDAEAGSALIEDALARSETIGAHLDRPLHLGLLAEALMETDAEAALRCTGQALTACDGERRYFWEPELRRLQALALYRTGHAEAAFEAFERALAAAEASGARWLAHRVALTRCRLDPGREECRALLARLEASLTEGESTPARREARRLLDPHFS